MAYSEVASITISDAYVGSSNSTNFPTLFRSPVGTVNTVTTAVTQETGDQFQSWMTSININGTVYAFTYLTATTGTLGTSAGTQTGVAYCGTPQLATVANGGYVQHTASLTVGARTYTVPTDLVFSSDNLAASLYSWEIETWNSATGAIIAWIQIPTLSHTANTVYYLSVGNASVTMFQGGSRGAAWDSNFKAVWHQPDGSTLYADDSTSNAVDGTVTAATAVAGEIDGAGSFNGSTGQILTGNNPYASSVFTSHGLTMSAWVKTTQTPGANVAIIASLEGAYVIDIAANTNNLGFEIDGTGTDIVASPTINDGNWHFVVGTSDSSGNLKTYVDGVASITGSQSFYNLDSLTRGYSIGAHPTIGGTYNFDGDIDEVRFSNTPRSASWITAEYNNQATPFTFYTMSSFAPPPSSLTNRNFLMLMGAGT